MAILGIVPTHTLKERQKRILWALVEEYIDSASPISSHQLVDKFRWPLSSATVRNELLALDDQGYLSQPHTSAGRVPTDKAYRFYIEERIEIAYRLPADEQGRVSRIARVREEDEFLKQVARAVSEIAEEFTLVGLHEDDIFYKAGISEVMRDPEFSNPEALQEFSRLMDFVDEEMTRMFNTDDFATPRAFVGAENPIREARNYGMVISAIRTPKGNERLLAILGPRRMNYRKNLSLFEYIRDVCE